jgi:hypothetical protein
MSATPIDLVIDAGTPVAAFTARHELQAYRRRRARHVLQPAGLHVLGQPRAVYHDHDGGAVGVDPKQAA